MKTKIFFLTIAVVLFAILLQSCDKSVFYNKTKPVDGDAWASNSPVKFDVEITDTARFYDFYINIRNTTDYSFSNLFLFLKTTFPNGKYSTDTIECYLADKEGKWLGRGLGKYKDNKILFHHKVIFPMKGVYSFEFEQAMRTEKLEAIDEIGIRLEYSDLSKKK